MTANFVIGTVRRASLRLAFFAHGVDLPPPRAAVYFFRAISVQGAVFPVPVTTKSPARSPGRTVQPGLSLSRQPFPLVPAGSAPTALTTGYRRRVSDERTVPLDF